MNQKRNTGIFIVMLALALSAAPTLSSDTDSLRQTLDAELNMQAEAWNRGDLKTFTSIYMENAVFVSPSGVTNGRNAVLARYLERYPDPAAMGQLELAIESVLPLGCRSQDDAHAAASVVATWTLRYPQDSKRQTVTGHTLLVFVQEGKKWRIAQDASM
jgi:uncharacterized protein (TIGR02246 family)